MADSTPHDFGKKITRYSTRYDVLTENGMHFIERHGENSNLAVFRVKDVPDPRPLLDAKDDLALVIHEHNIHRSKGGHMERVIRREQRQIAAVNA